MSIIIREAKLEDAKDIAFVHTMAWKESYPGMIDQDYLDHEVTLESRIKRREESLSNPDGKHTHLLAKYEGETVAFACYGAFRENTYVTHPPDGEISAIYILNKAKRKGIGKKLFHTITCALLEKDMSSMGIWVLQNNDPARSFYEKMGGSIDVTDVPITIGGKEYQECLYRYNDLKHIIDV